MSRETLQKRADVLEGVQHGPRRHKDAQCVVRAVEGVKDLIVTAEPLNAEEFIAVTLELECQLRPAAAHDRALVCKSTSDSMHAW